MSRPLYFLLVLPFLLLGFNLQAQDTLGVSSGSVTIYNLTPSNPIGASDSVNVFFKNKATTKVFTGTISISMAVDTGSGLNIFSNDTVAATLNPGDSISKQLMILYNPTQFRVGTNIVVIWPSVSSGITVDSAMGAVTLYSVTGMNEMEAHYKLSLFPNPSNGQFSLLMKEAGSLSIQSSQVISMEGKELFGSNDNNPVFDLSMHPDGNYLIRVTYSDGHIEHHQLLKTSRR